MENGHARKRHHAQGRKGEYDKGSRGAVQGQILTQRRRNVNISHEEAAKQSKGGCDGAAVPPLLTTAVVDAIIL